MKVRAAISCQQAGNASWRIGNTSPNSAAIRAAFPYSQTLRGMCREGLPFSSFGDEAVVFGEPTEVHADLLWLLGCLIVDARRPTKVGLALDLLDLKALLPLHPLLLQPRPNPLVHML